MSPSLGKRPRGFMLLVIIVIGAAAMAAAIVLISVGGASRLIGTKSEGEDRARALAWTGSERAFLYLQEFLKTERDFDRVFEPGDSCANANGLPAYTGTSTVSYDGRTFNLVPDVDGGAYLTRFFDDADDLMDDDQFTPFTSNHSPAGACDEGPTVAGGDNPTRDRNRSIWVEVVGIHAGNNPARASHRVKLLRQFVSTRPVPQLVVTIGRDLTAADVDFCSPLGDIGVGRNTNVSGTLGMCGLLSSGGTVTASAPVAPSPACSPACSVASAPATGVPLTPTFPQVGNLLSGGSPCNFYLRSNGASDGLYYWNPPTLDINGVACSAYTGIGVPTPGTPAPQAPCWKPIVTAAQDFVNGGAPAFPFVWDVGATSGAPISGGGTFPDWSATCTGAVGWPLPSGGGSLACMTCGPVLSYDGPSDKFTISADARVNAPPGTYFVDVGGSGGVSRLDFTAATGGGVVATRQDWAPMTFVIFNGARIGGGAGRLGTASADPFPSLVGKGGTITLDAPLEFVGNVFVDTDFVMNGAAHFYGRLHVGNNATFNQPLQVDYNTSLVDPATVLQVFPTPTTSRMP